MDNKNSISRRTFLGSSAAAAVGLTIVPSNVMGSTLGHKAPSDKLNIAGVGVGGMGFSNLKAMETENIVALCDVDWKYCEGNGVFARFPNAQKFWDWREMYEKIGKSIDAVVVGTADHSHALIAANAMTLGKHVYVQKPLTHSVYESRLLTKLAKYHKVATSMGNQGSSAAGVRQSCEWIWDGQIGEVTKVEAFTDRPIWPQGLNVPGEVHKVPDTLRWDLFIGSAPDRPYNSIYHPWNWRGWWDFGTGALGDMACHILHPVFKGLKLQYPIAVQASSTMLLTDCAPNAQKVKLIYPARPDMPKVKMPEVEVHWYDGGIRPEMPKGWPAGRNMDNSGGGVIFHGTKDTLICGCYGARPWLLSGRTPQSPKVLREITVSHEQDWIRACKESADNRVMTASDFSEAGPFNEMVVMGVMAVRLQGLFKELTWDGENMQFTNISDTDSVRWVKKDGFTIKDGHPSFAREMYPAQDQNGLNAKALAAELVKHTYQHGYSLPAMPTI